LREHSPREQRARAIAEDEHRLRRDRHEPSRVAMKNLIRSKLCGACLIAAEVFQLISGRFLAASEKILTPKK
jgi:hypothetical protein